MIKEFKTLSPYFKRYKEQYITGLLVLVIVDGAQMLIPQWLKRAIDIIAQGSYTLPSVVRYGALMVATMAVVALGRFLWRWFIHGASRRIEAEIREKIFSHLLTLDYTFYQNNKTGDLMARATNDLGAVRMSIGFGIVALIDGTAMALSILIIIFVQDWHTALLAVLPLPVITIFIMLFGSAVGKRFGRAQEAYSSMSNVVEETFAGINVVKSFVKENLFLKKFSDTNEDYKTANMILARIFGFFFPAVTFLSGLTTIIVLFVGGSRVIAGVLTPGTLVALISYFQMLIWPVLGAGFTVNMMQRGAVSLGRINEILQTKSEIVSGTVTEAADAGGIDIEIKNLTFAYPASKDAAAAVKNVSLSVKKGEWLGIMGKTGAGKTTLIKLLARLADPPRGTVFVKGVDVRDWDLKALRSLFGYALQDSYLFSDTVAGNIAYYADNKSGGTGVPTSGCLQDIIALASLERDMQILKDGEATLVGERGLTLSGGQKQRVAIARAALIDPAILVLDDSLSAVDTETEKRILDALYAARRGKTTIIISHRISVFRNADNIAALEDGVLTDYGSREDLLAKDGYYAKIARIERE